MFKSKKINENAIKKDFFKVKKTISEKLININSETKGLVFFENNNLENQILPEKNEIFFVITSLSRSLVNFVSNKNTNQTLLFCSRLDKKSFEIIKNKNLIGIGLSERVLQNNPDFYNEVKKSTIVKISNNHSKMLLFNIEDNFYIISGSGNASINSRIENYIIENNEEKYNQIKSFFQNA
jgi:hypothetical protein